MNKRYDIGVEPNTVFGEFNRDTKTLLITGEENKEMDKYRFWEFVANVIPKVKFNDEKDCLEFDSDIDYSYYKIIIKDPIALPEFSTNLFANFPMDIQMNDNVHMENVMEKDNML